MDYLLLIREPRGQRAERTEPEGRAAFAVMNAWAETLKAKGTLRAVSSLLPDDQGSRVEVREGRVRTLDGPVVESKEMIGGFFLVDCASREQALALAAECPAAAWATVEVRPVGPCFER